MGNTLILFPTITARHIMTPREDWLVLEPGGRREEILHEARRNHYDLIPVRDENRRVSSFLLAPDYREIPLQLDWCCTHDTPLDTLLDYFVQSGHPGYFLLCEGEVIGLVTPADFNKAVARSAIYMRLAELEILLVRFLSRQYADPVEKILSSVSEKRRKDLENRLAEQRAKNVDVNLLEELYLPDLLNLLEKDDSLRRLLHYPSRKQVEEATSGLVDLRNDVAHAVRKIHKDMDIKQMHTRLKKVEDLIRRVREVLSGEDAPKT